MSPLRIIGYIGIALLGMLCIFIFWMSLINGELKGLLVSAGFFLVLAFFSYGLRNEVVENISGLMGFSFSSHNFFHGVMLKSLNGWLVLACVGVCLLNILLMIPKWSWTSFFFWLSYPLLPFVVWVKLLSSPRCYHEKSFSVTGLTVSAYYLLYFALFAWSLFLPAKSLWSLLTGSDSIL